MNSDQPSRQTDFLRKTQVNRGNLDLSKIRHELRTPINHIIGYCEMLEEEEGIPDSFLADLNKIHSGGRRLQWLIGEYFDEEKFASARRNVGEIFHELRTPVNQIVGYAELLQELAAEIGQLHLIADLKKIHTAATTWLALMEEYLLPPEHGLGVPATSATMTEGPASLFDPGISYSVPQPRTVAVPHAHKGALLIVDDDSTNREMLARRLSRDGYTVSLAENGLEALRLVRAQRFDLVLLDMLMPGLDGYQVLVKMKADVTLRHIPVIMISGLDQESGIARCIEVGAEDYLSKPFNSVFLRARIGACLEKKQLRDQEQQTYQALVQSQKRLAAELAEAADYVRSLLPKPLDGRVRTDWCFQPSAQLGGDSFGYHWLDDDHLAIYLLDVCGHGVGAALLSVSAMNVLRSQALLSVNFRNPGDVLAGLNRAFKMEDQNNMYFTIWYGVFHAPTRRILYASGGHPPSVLLTGASVERAEVIELRTAGPVIGCLDEIEFPSGTVKLDAFAKLYVLSDGVYEIARTDGSMMTLPDFVEHLAGSSGQRNVTPGGCLKFIQQLHGSPALEDDFSLLEVEFR